MSVPLTGREVVAGLGDALDYYRDLLDQLTLPELVRLGNLVGDFSVAVNAAAHRAQAREAPP